MVLTSFAKLNLYLEVLNIRKDGYHNIRTIFERISLCDKIILKARQDSKIKISCRSKDVPQDNTNLTYRAAKLLQEKFGLDKGVEIRIIKRIPVGAGLGGGSSNAASVLLGLNKLWKLKLKRERLVPLAKEIGADVPFFIYNTPIALGCGRGDIIRPLKELKNRRFWHVLVVPKINVSTPFIYKQWDKEGAGLTKPKYSVKITNLPGSLFNSLEAVTSRLYPEVEEIKEQFRDSGLKKILMSGSGPAVFALVSSRKEASRISRQLMMRNISGRVFTVWTI